MTLRPRLAAIACAAVLAACKPAPDATMPAPRSAQPAPDATVAATPAARPEIPSLVLDTVDGKRFDLASHRGKWVVVNFWATWCSPCLKEMPALSALDTMREHIDVVGLAYEDITPQAMRAFLAKHPVSYPVALVDVYEPPADFETPPGLPTTYLIAPDGKVARRFLGPVEMTDIEAAIAKAGGPAPVAPEAG